MGANPDPRGRIDGRAAWPPPVRPGRRDDAAAVARLHASAIGEGFLSALGPGFLTRLYRRIIGEPGSFLLVADRDGGSGRHVAGFVAGSQSVRRLYRSFLVRDGIPAAAGSALRLARSLPRVLETLRHGTGGGDEGSGRGTELLSIAVDPTARGGGLGQALVDGFLDEVTRRGGRAAHVVVGADNQPAVRLYQRAGFVVVRRFELHAGTPSLLLQWEHRPRAGSDEDEADDRPVEGPRA